MTKMMVALLLALIAVSAQAKFSPLEEPSPPAISPTANFLLETQAFDTLIDGESTGRATAEAPPKFLSDNGFPASAVVLFIVGISCVLLLRRRTLSRH